MRLEPAPRIVDGAILLAVVAAGATGLLTAFAGRPSDAWVFVVHGIAGLLLAVLLAWKLRRVAPRLRPSRVTPAVALSALAAAVAVLTLATGVYWVLGGNFTVLAWNAMNVHAFLGIALAVLLAAHLTYRFRLPRRADVEGRRSALRAAALVGGGVLAWRLQQAAVEALETAGATRRFTGSKERAGAAGNDFPVTSWVADDPDPIDPDEWRLRVRGAVDRERSFAYGDLAPADGETAVLDCTSGWYAERDWRGVRVGRLLEAVDPADDARWVSFRSATGYRWSLPIGEARGALLATHVGDEPLSHGHGFPARLVAPGRRGFQWVKWVVAVEVRRDPDYGQWVAIFASGFTPGRD